MTALGSGPGLRAERIGDVAVAARDARQRWNVQAVAVTLGSAGALLIDGDGPPLVVPASPAGSGDTCGAGDRLVSATAGRLHHGALLSEALVDAVAEAGRFVAAGGARGFGRAAAARGALDLRQDGFGRAAAARGALDLRQDGPAPEGPEVAEGAVTPGVVGLAQARWGAERVRAGGGTVVVAGGCFDLLHAGHVALLQAARQLGDYLVVALNSDASVRRLKGPGRPVVPQADRAALLAAVRCVDAVVIFEEDGPEAVLEALRPHLFAKGGDYSARPLPESFILARWGGHAVVLPYLSGRSTTRVVEALGGPARAGDERGWP
jgi:D-beta-D-heptose 7-phosphate kinase/D-beta-D-heptose 1-phosphate adenosyltransferase